MINSDNSLPETSQASTAEERVHDITKERHALELRAEVINLVAGKKAERKGLSDRLEIGIESATDTAYGKEELHVGGGLSEEANIAETTGLMLSMTVYGKLNLNYYSDTLITAGGMLEQYTGGEVIAAGMSDNLLGGGGIRIRGADLRMNAASVVEEKVSTLAIDGLVAECCSTACEQEEGNAIYSVGFASYKGTMEVLTGTTMRPMCRALFGVRTKNRGGGGGSGGDSNEPSPEQSPAAASPESSPPTKTLLPAGGSSGNSVGNLANTVGTAKNAGRIEDVVTNADEAISTGHGAKVSKQLDDLQQTNNMKGAYDNSLVDTLKLEFQDEALRQDNVSYLSRSSSTDNFDLPLTPTDNTLIIKPDNTLVTNKLVTAPVNSLESGIMPKLGVNDIPIDKSLDARNVDGNNTLSKYNLIEKVGPTIPTKPKLPTKPTLPPKPDGLSGDFKSLQKNQGIQRNLNINQNQIQIKNKRGARSSDTALYNDKVLRIESSTNSDKGYKQVFNDNGVKWENTSGKYLDMSQSLDSPYNRVNTTQPNSNSNFHVRTGGFDDVQDVEEAKPAIPDSILLKSELEELEETTQSQKSHYAAVDTAPTPQKTQYEEMIPVPIQPDPFDQSAVPNINTKKIDYTIEDLDIQRMNEIRAREEGIITSRRYGLDIKREVSLDYLIEINELKKQKLIFEGKELDSSDTFIKITDTKTKLRDYDTEDATYMERLKALEDPNFDLRTGVEGKKLDKPVSVKRRRKVIERIHKENILIKKNLEESLEKLEESFKVMQDKAWEPIEDQFPELAKKYHAKYKELKPRVTTELNANLDISKGRMLALDDMIDAVKSNQPPLEVLRRNVEAAKTLQDNKDTRILGERVIDGYHRYIKDLTENKIYNKSLIEETKKIHDNIIQTKKQNWLNQMRINIDEVNDIRLRSLDKNLIERDLDLYKLSDVEIEKYIEEGLESAGIRVNAQHQTLSIIAKTVENGVPIDKTMNILNKRFANIVKSDGIFSNEAMAYREIMNQFSDPSVVALFFDPDVSKLRNNVSIHGVDKSKVAQKVTNHLKNLGSFKSADGLKVNNNIKLKRDLLTDARRQIHKGDDVVYQLQEGQVRLKWDLASQKITKAEFDEQDKIYTETIEQLRNWLSDPEVQLSREQQIASLMDLINPNAEDIKLASLDSNYADQYTYFDDLYFDPNKKVANYNKHFNNITTNEFSDKYINKYGTKRPLPKTNTAKHIEADKLAEVPEISKQRIQELDKSFDRVKRSAIQYPYTKLVNNADAVDSRWKQLTAFNMHQNSVGNYASISDIYSRKNLQRAISSAEENAEIFQSPSTLGFGKQWDNQKLASQGTSASAQVSSTPTVKTELELLIKASEVPPYEIKPVFTQLGGPPPANFQQLNTNKALSNPLDGVEVPPRVSRNPKFSNPQPSIIRSNSFNKDIWMTTGEITSVLRNQNKVNPTFGNGSNDLNKLISYWMLTRKTIGITIKTKAASSEVEDKSSTR